MKKGGTLSQEKPGGTVSCEHRKCRIALLLALKKAKIKKKHPKCWPHFRSVNCSWNTVLYPALRRFAVTLLFYTTHIQTMHVKIHAICTDMCIFYFSKCRRIVRSNKTRFACVNVHLFLESTKWQIALLAFFVLKNDNTTRTTHFQE